MSMRRMCRGKFCRCLVLLVVIIILSIIVKLLTQSSHGGVYKSHTTLQQISTFVIIERRTDPSRCSYQVTSIEGLKKRSSVITGPIYKSLLSPNKAKRELSGNLTVQIWGEICGQNLQNLKNFALFPKLPSATRQIQKFQTSYGRKSYGQRIYGFIRPKTAGEFQLLLNCHGNAQMWLSTDSTPGRARLVAHTNPNPKFSQNMDEFTAELEAGKEYYVEVLHKVDEEDDTLKVLWRKKGHSTMEVIGQGYISEYSSELSAAQENNTNLHLLTTFPGHVKEPYYTYKSEGDKQRSQMFTLPFLDASETVDLFSECSYNPSYLVKHKLKRYGGVWEPHYTAIFPPDFTNLTFEDTLSLGNDLLERPEAENIAWNFFQALDSKHPGKYSLVGILNVEENMDKKKGKRYLVELKIQERKTGKHYRVSEYIYKPNGKEELCYPENFKWNKTAVVNVILTAGGMQGRWVKHFIDNMVRIYNRTKDPNFHVILVDFFETIDLDLKMLLESSGLEKYTLLRIPGKFHKTIGIQEAARLVSDPNQLIFQCDLHVDLPDSTFDVIRKHCIKNKVSFSPLLVRLGCGYIPPNVEGFWETDGYGPFAIYKEDWDQFGGMNVEEFKNSWGGEDWEMVDRVLMAGYEIDRIKLPHFYHYFHSKKGMWTQA